MTDWAWLPAHAPASPVVPGLPAVPLFLLPRIAAARDRATAPQGRIPTDVLWLDIDFQHNNWPFTVNKQAFPDFRGMVQDLAREHFKLVVITDLHIASQPKVGLRTV